MKIHNKENGSRIVWNPEADAPLLIFKGGVFATNDPEVKKKAEALGYKITEDEQAEEQPKRKRATKKAE